MGTRHIIAVVKDGVFKVAQYGQWDGNPGGQGEDVVAFLRGKGNLEKLTANLAKCRFLDAEGKDKAFVESYNAQPTPEQSKWFDTFISRDLSAEVLANIANATSDEILLRDEIEFAKKSLHCEWGYVIDLDRQTLEVYKGFQTSKPTAGRFADQKPDRDNGYFPIALVATIPIVKLDDRSMSNLEKDDDEDE